LLIYAIDLNKVKTGRVTKSKKKSAAVVEEGCDDDILGSEVKGEGEGEEVGK